MEDVDEEGVEQGIDDHGADGGIHSLLRITRCAEYSIQPEIEVGDDIAEKDNLHIVGGIADCSLTAAEEVENGGEERKDHQGEGQTENDIEHQYVAQYTLGRGVVLLSQLHRDEGRCTHAH